MEVTFRCFFAPVTILPQAGRGKGIFALENTQAQFPQDQSWFLEFVAFVLFPTESSSNVDPFA
jgi:hypothetical protein